MIGTERFERLQRWYSMKAIAILNCIEFVFWIALIAINIRGTKACSGLGCTLSGLTIALGFLLAQVSLSHFSPRIIILTGTTDFLQYPSPTSRSGTFAITRRMVITRTKDIT